MEKHRCFGCMGVTENTVCEKCGWPLGKNNEPHQLPVGTRLHGQYVIGRVLGQGGFGITYLGWDDYLDMPVAVKEFYPNSMVTRECSVSLEVHCITEQVRPGYDMSKERFLREAKALAMLRDVPEVVRIHGFFEENGTAYIVMEYVRGTDLATYVARRGGRLTPDETFRILWPVMRALDRVHQADLVHRDISPDNIMLHPRGGAKLLDFGAVRNVEGAEAGKDMAHSTEAILKHGFAPAEQYKSRGGLGPWSDEYAMCATVYYCLTGRIPPQAVERMLEDIPVEFDIPGLPKHQREALEKGMAIRAKDRHGSMRALMEALFPPQTGAAEQQPWQRTERMPQKPPAEKTVQPAPEKTAATVVMGHGQMPRKKKPWWLILAAALAVVALIAAGAAGLLMNAGPEESLPAGPVETDGKDKIEERPQEETAADPPAEEPVGYAPEISLWVYPVGIWGDADFVSSALDEFHARYPKIRVTVKYLDYATGDDMVKAGLEAEMGPDVLLADPVRLIAGLGNDGHLADISDLWELDGEGIYPGVKSDCTGADGGIYMYPYCMGIHTMAIDKLVFEQAGAMTYIDEQTHTWTTEGFMKAMEAVQRYTGSPAGMIYCGGQGGDQGTRVLVTNLCGGTFTDPGHTRYTWDQEEMIDALELIDSMVGVGFDPSLAGGDTAMHYVDGYMPMTFCWNHSLHGSNEALLDGQRVFPMAFPAPQGTAPRLEGNVFGFGILDRGDEGRIASAKAFIRFACSEYVWERGAETSFLPVKASGQWELTPIQQEYIRFLPYYGGDHSMTPGWANAREQWRAMLQEIAYGGDIRETVAIYTEKANAFP